MGGRGCGDGESEQGGQITMEEKTVGRNFVPWDRLKEEES